MKKLLLIFLMLLTVLSVEACGGSNNEPYTPEQPGTSEQPDEEGNDKPDTPAPGGKGRYLVLYNSRTSNTERVAKRIQAVLNCDILEVEPQMPYENDYNSMLKRAQEELAAIRQGNYPAVKTSVENFDDYDIVFMASKQVALFATSGSSGISTSVSEVRKLCPYATIINQTLLLTSSDLSQMDTHITEWLNKIGVKREDQE